jgi:hypothetical protein
MVWVHCYRIILQGNELTMTVVEASARRCRILLQGNKLTRGVGASLQYYTAG